MSKQREAVPGWDRRWRGWGAPHFGAQKPRYINTKPPERMPTARGR